MAVNTPGSLPADPAELATALPDLPQWVYARSLLLSGTASVLLSAAGDAALVLDPATAVLVGHPDQELLRTALAGDPPVPTLLAHEDALIGVHAALPTWSAQRFIVHTLLRPVPPDTPPPPGVLVFVPLDPAALAGLPQDLRAEAADAPAAAVRLNNGEPVAVCFVADLTETLWDVGVDTVEQARDRGTPRPRSSRSPRRWPRRAASRCGPRTRTTPHRSPSRPASASSRSPGWPS
ncbi:MAG: hypothetical protein M3P96_15030 [Actinomycetota bacterium]|nr:hypothetical protein [Actinomycetota bacterium]